jgi:phytanoyl-CoA hydroxylase
MIVHSDLWLDQPDAHDRIEARRAAGVLTATEAEQLHGFVDYGYIKLHLGLDKAFCDALDDEIAALWEQRPADLAVSPFSGGPISFPDYDGPVRERGYRLPDLHGHSKRALALYLHPALFRLVELIFDEPALAFQSLYFEHGSTQGLHRDPMFVATRPVSNLCAAWIALEDIPADSGPLAYVPGSHRMPWFEFEPGTVICGQSVSRERRAEFAAWQHDKLRELGLERQAFTCERGDVFIWHGGLVHGGEAIQNPERTRKSFVVHYSTAADYKSRTARMQMRDGDSLRTVARGTEKVIERDGARGLDSPLRSPIRASGQLASPPAEHPRRPARPARLARLVERVKPWSDGRNLGTRSGRKAHPNPSA